MKEKLLFLIVKSYLFYKAVSPGEELFIGYRVGAIVATGIKMKTRYIDGDAWQMIGLVQEIRVPVKLVVTFERHANEFHLLLGIRMALDSQHHLVVDDGVLLWSVGVSLRLRFVQALPVRNVVVVAGFVKSAVFVGEAAAGVPRRL